MNAAGRRLLLRALAVLIPLALLAAGSDYRIRPRNVGIDDANICFVYARNLLAGHGFVYHPGGERVEGFTSFLWTLLCALAFALSPKPESLLLLLNVLIVAAGLLAGLGFVERLAASRSGQAERTLGPAGALFLGWCLLTPGYLLWTTVSLLETGLWSPLLLAGAIAVIEAGDRPGMLERAARRLCWIGPLLWLTRPDALAWVPALLLLLALAARVQLEGWGPAARVIAWPAAAFAASVAALTAFRLAYFGWPFPNTYYAKVSPALWWAIGEGLEYLRKFALYAVLVPLALLLAARLLSRTPRVPGDFALGTLVALGVAIPVGLGGDHFVLLRFFQPIWPLLGLVLLRSFAAGLARLDLWTLPGLLGLLYLMSPNQWHAPSVFEREFRIASDGREMGLVLNQVFAGVPPPRVGVIAAGGIALTYQGEIVDLMGLNNTRMGHAPGERRGWKNHAAFHKAVFFELDPDLLLPVLLPRARIATWAAEQLKPRTYTESALKGLLRDPDFNARYVPATIDLHDQGGAVLFAWFRARDVEDLRARGFPIEVAPLREGAP